VYNVFAGFRNNFQDYRRLAEKRVIGGCQKAGTSFLKRVTGRIFTISKRFQRGKQKIFFTKRQPKNCENCQHSYKTYKLIFLKFKTIAVDVLFKAYPMVPLSYRSNLAGLYL
jgi:hypothetical protein